MLYSVKMDAYGDQFMMELDVDDFDYATDENNKTHCAKFFNETQIVKIIITAGTIGTASVVFCVVGLALVIYYKLHKQIVYRLASYQVFGSMLVSIMMVLATVPITHDTSPMHIMCRITGFFLEYFLWVKLLIALCLVFHIFCIGVIRKSFEKPEVYYALVSFGFPLLFVWIPFVTSSFGLTQSWCWIKDAHCTAELYKTGLIEQYTLWYGPLVACIVFSVVLITITLVSFKCRYNKIIETSESVPLLEDTVKQYMLNVYFRKLLPLLVYPIVFFLLFLFPTGRKLKSKKGFSLGENFVISLTHTAIYCSFGFFSGVVLIIHVMLVRRLKPSLLGHSEKSFVNAASGKLNSKKPNF